MAQFFVSFSNDQAEQDEMSLECTDFETAMVEAGRMVGDLIRDNPSEVWTTDLQCQIADERHMTLGLVIVSGTLSAAVRK